MKKFVNEMMSLFLTGVLIFAPTMTSFAAPVINETVDCANIGVSPRALLTLTDTFYNTHNTVGVDVTYVVNDGTGQLVQIKSAKVSWTNDLVKVTSIKTYVNSSGSYGTVTIKWTYGVTSTTSVIEIYP